MYNNPIGIFDSGVGGLSVFAELIKLLPNENYLYFGDTKNLPYGDKSKEELIKICSEIFNFFEENNVKAVVMACNTTSATVYNELKDKYSFKIYPVVQSVSKQIALKNYSSVGVFATQATINTHAYKNEIQKYNPHCRVYETACPKWVNIVENSLQNDKENIENIKFYVESMLLNKVEKIILGCTHYPYLLKTLSKFAPSNMFINPAKYFSEFIYNDLKNCNLINYKMDFEPKFYVSHDHEHFKKASELFYNVKDIQEINVSKIML